MRKVLNIIGGLLLLMAATAIASPSFAANYNVINTFCREGGSCPNGSDGFGLVRDASGNLYGVAKGGVPYSGVGIVFELSPNTSPGAWSYRIIHTFCETAGCEASSIPATGLIIDKSGNLYGTTLGGGPPNAGVVYKLSPNADRSQWSYAIIARFGEERGWEPFGDLSYVGKSTGLPYDGISPLYGETDYSSQNGFHGAVYELRPADGTPAWTFNTIYRFCKTDCLDGDLALPVTVDSVGNLYGSTELGGQHAAGVVFRLSPKPHHGWKQMVLHAFCSEANCADGQTPTGSVYVDGSGNIFGITSAGGASCAQVSQGCGVAYELLPDGHERVLHTFCQTDCADGASPVSLVSDGAGNLFGLSSTGTFVLRNGKRFEMLLPLCQAKACGNPYGFSVYSPTALVGTGANGLFGSGVVFEITHKPLP
ncbi:MAG TPA: choice-of-anchor tandem repeat GloVer-containing protein [Rhizomicrobium sp.]